MGIFGAGFGSGFASGSATGMALARQWKESALENELGDAAKNAGQTEGRADLSEEQLAQKQAVVDAYNSNPDMSDAERKAAIANIDQGFESNRAKTYTLGSETRDTPFSQSEIAANRNRAIADVYRNNGKAVQAMDYEDKAEAAKLRGVQVRDAENQEKLKTMYGELSAKVKAGEITDGDMYNELLSSGFGNIPQLEEFRKHRKEFLSEGGGALYGLHQYAAANKMPLEKVAPMFEEAFNKVGEMRGMKVTGYNAKTGDVTAVDADGNEHTRNIPEMSKTYMTTKERLDYDVKGQQLAEGKIKIEELIPAQVAHLKASSAAALSSAAANAEVRKAAIEQREEQARQREFEKTWGSVDALQTRQQKELSGFAGDDAGKAALEAKHADERQSYIVGRLLVDNKQLSPAEAKFALTEYKAGRVTPNGEVLVGDGKKAVNIHDVIGKPPAKAAPPAGGGPAPAPGVAQPPAAAIPPRPAISSETATNGTYSTDDDPRSIGERFSDWQRGKIKETNAKIDRAIAAQRGR